MDKPLATSEKRCGDKGIRCRMGDTGYHHSGPCHPSRLAEGKGGSQADSWGRELCTEGLSLPRPEAGAGLGVGVLEREEDPRVCVTSTESGAGGQSRLSTAL